MNRPTKEMPPARDHRITIRITNDLYELLKQEARDSGTTIAELVREKITSRTVVVRPEIVFNDQRILNALGDIGKIGSNLNQIAHHLNGGGMVTTSLCSDIRAALAELFRMRNEIKEMAGEYRGNC